jgi:hypothetical protein
MLTIALKCMLLHKLSMFITALLERLRFAIGFQTSFQRGSAYAQDILDLKVCLMPINHDTSM